MSGAGAMQGVLLGSKKRFWAGLVPQMIPILRKGYGFRHFGADAIAGLTVAIVALPLAMALAIASGTTPDKGLVTAIVAGFLISALGGSRVQIGGPTGAFVVVVFNVIAAHGYDGLLMATLMAGVFLIVAGLLGLGSVIKYMPQPVITGFTAGIALIIFSSQVKDFFGLSIEHVPAEFIEKWHVYFSNLNTANLVALAVAAGALVLIVTLRHFFPKVPSFLLAVVGGGLLVWAFELPVDTIGSKFGDLPNTLPQPAWPVWEWGRVKELLPSALTIAFLAGIESLLSAVVADGMTGGRHKSNCELVAQGVANTASVFFGGLPATGAIARTVTNIRSGAYSPVAGMLHAVFLLISMFFLAPLAKYVPLGCLAAVLIVVAWNMSEIGRFRHLMNAPKGDRLVLVLTFLLTALVDLTVAIEVGVVLAALIFMVRMARLMEIKAGGMQHAVQDVTSGAESNATSPENLRRGLPPEAEIFHFNGPFFFGVTSMLMDATDGALAKPKVYILEMTEVPLIDASGAAALDEFVGECHKKGAVVLVAGLKGQPRKIFGKMHLLKRHHNLKLVEDHASALAEAWAIAAPHAVACALPKV